MSNITLPTPQPLLSRTGWAAWLAALIVLCALVPVLNLMVPEGSVLHLSDFAVALTAKIMCYSICALAMGLIWGYTGILSLGHGLFFALGGYAMGMYLMRQIGARGVYANPVLPDFMVFLNYKELPWYWLGFDMFWFAMIDVATSIRAMSICWPCPVTPRCTSAARTAVAA